MRRLALAPPVPAAVVGVLRGIDLYGGNYRAVIGPQANPEGCQTVCRADGQCLAWTYLRPGIMGSDARCILKSRIPAQVASACCISGIERQTAANPAPAIAAPPAASSGPLHDTDLRGSSYRNFELSADNWALCQSACKADNECLAWTSEHPGRRPNAVCWMKNKVPQPTPNSCCTSGVERAEAK